MPFDKCHYNIRICWHSDRVSNIKGKEIGGGNEPVNRLKSYMVGIDMVGLLPTNGPDSIISLRTETRRFSSHKSVLSM